MPTYEFYCDDCHKTFEAVIPISEYGKQPVQCPECKGTHVKRQVSTFEAVTSKKS